MTFTELEKLAKKPPSRRTKIISKATKRVKDTSLATPTGKPSVQPAVRAPVRKIKRVKVRYAFEFYQDQIARLRELRKSAILRDDENFSMSKIVRQAIDAYFKSKA